MIVRGRIRSFRPSGGITFFHVVSQSGRTQVALTKALTQDYLTLRSSLSTGCIVECEGEVDKTRTGDDALFAKTVTLLVKPSILIPEDDSLQDPEARLRSRHLDLISNRASFDRLQKRFVMTMGLRSYLTSRGFIEVETPILQPIPGGAAARPFITHHNVYDEALYLRIAPELYLKRLLVGGFESIFEIGRVFRNEGVDARHNPEFTMVELYQAYSDVSFMKELLVKILNYFGVFSPITQVATEADLTNKGWEMVTFFSMEETPLAKPMPGNASYADRFELYYNGMEIANGYTEENDPEAVLQRMRAYSPNPDWVDTDFVETLRAGMPPASGMGIGIDRLAMMLSDASSIRDVIAFPTLRKTPANA